MAEAASRAATYADLEAVRPHLVAEIVLGDLIAHPRPAPRHAIATFELSYELNGPYGRGRGGPGGWVFLVEPELHFGPDVLVPDIAGWRRDRLAAISDAPWIETPPDWVCEVLSRSTEPYDRGPKRQIYGTAGVGYLWLVDPRAKLLEAFALSGGKWLLTAALRDSEDVSVPPFDAISFSLGLLWPRDAPADPSAGP